MRKINYVKLGNVCRVVSGSTPKKSNTEYWGGDIPWITPAEIDNAAHYVWDTERHITELGVEKASLKELPVGTVLLSSRAPIGKVAITKTPMFCNQGFKNLICSDQVLNEYLYRYLRANTARLQSCGRGATFKELSKKDVENIILPLPSISCQKNIVSKLESIDNVILCLNRLLELFNDLVKSRFVEMFGNADSSSANFNISTINEICSSIVRGPFGSALKKEFFIPRGVGTYKVYEQKHAIRKRADIGTYYISKEKFDSLKRFECKPGDILMSCSGTMGELYQLPMNCEPGIINQALCKFTLNEKILPEYFFRFMSQVVDDLGAKGSGIKNVSSVKYIKDIKIPLPPLSLQQEFAAFVHQVDKLKFDFDFLVSFGIPSICLFCLKLDP